MREGFAFDKEEAIYGYDRSGGLCASTRGTSELKRQVDTIRVNHTRVTCVTLVIRGTLTDADIVDLRQRLALGISAGVTRGCDGIGFRGFGVDVCIGHGT